MIHNSLHISTLFELQGYEFDSIGNRQQSTVNGEQSTYSSNELNQYTSRTVPGTVSISGSANPDATVTIQQISLGENGFERVTRPLGASLFHKSYSLDNSSSPVSDTFKIWATLDNSIDTQTLDISIPKSPETFTHDPDGNLLSDGQFNYTWNAENQLIAVESILPQDNPKHIKIEFAYDYMGRRISKKVWKWVGTDTPIVIPPEVQAQINRINNTRDRLVTQITSTYDAIISRLQSQLDRIRIPRLKQIIERQITTFENLKTDSVERINTLADSQITRIYTNAGIDPSAPTSSTPEFTLTTDAKFAYDGWNCIAIIVSPSTLYKSYLWGEDLSGSLQGAGGVGGLLVTTHHTASKSYFPCYDGNGNIMAYVDASNGNKVAEFEYKPDGNFIIDNDPFNLKEVAAFSTKPCFMGIVWFELRPTKDGRGLKRDPIGISGGHNEYIINQNDHINKIDYLGLAAYLVYRRLDIDYLRATHDWPGKPSGHVYLAFDDECTGKKWKEELIKHKGKGIDTTVKTNDYHTFSFHPWSVKPLGDEHGNYLRKSSGEFLTDTSHNRLSVVVTDSTYVWYRDIIGDVYPIIDKDALLAEITNDEDAQIKLFRLVVDSWKINSKSPESNDIGLYSFSKNNCAHWSVTMIRNAGLQPPPISYGFNLGTGVGGPLDWTGLPQATYYSARGAVDAYDFTKDQGSQFTEALLEGWGIKPANPTPKPPPTKYVGFWEALKGGYGFE